MKELIRVIVLQVLFPLACADLTENQGNGDLYTQSDPLRFWSHFGEGKRHLKKQH